MSLGIYVPDLLGSTVFSASLIGLTYGIFNLLWGTMSPIAGAFAEQKGYVKTLCVGFIGVSLSFYVASSAVDPIHFLFGIGVIGGLSAGVISVPVIIGGVSKFYADDKTQSTVTGILMSIAASGMFIFTPINQFLVSTYQWSLSFQITSIFFLFMIPLSLIFLLPKLEKKNKKEFTKRKISDVLQEAFKDKSYKYLILGFFVCGLHVALISNYLPVFTKLKGLETTIAATGLTLIGIFNMMGTLISGKISGIIKKKYVLSFIYFSRSIVIFFLLILPTNNFVVIGFSCLIGLLWLSTVPPTSGIVANRFGTRYLSTLFGIVMVSHQAGAFFGSFVGGLVIDAYGSLDLAWIMAIVISLFSAFIHLPIVEKEKSEEVFA
jgi:predicted MFS family arabinose efflux permease